MLIHKGTMGVLDSFWTGEFIQVGVERVPIMAEYTLANTELDPKDWWEIPRTSRLGRFIRLSYPWCDPVVDEAGDLIWVEPWPAWRRDGLPEPPDVPQETETTQLKRRRRPRRRRGIFEDLLVGKG